MSRGFVSLQIIFSQVDDRVDEHSGAWGEPSVNSTMATIEMTATIAVEDLFPLCFRRTVSVTYL